MPDLTLCYSCTPDPVWRRKASVSAYTALRHSPDLNVRIVEVTLPPTTPTIYTMKAEALPELIRTAWVLYLDADTTVHGDLRRLIEGKSCKVPLLYARKLANWGKVDKEAWRDLLWHFSCPYVPIPQGGALLMNRLMALRMKAQWIDTIRRLDELAIDPLQSVNGFRRGWWLDQAAAGIVAGTAGGARIEWTAKEHSFAFRREREGLIRHWSDHWKDPIDHAGRL